MIKKINEAFDRRFDSALDEALPKDLMQQIRRAGTLEKGDDYFNTGGGQYFNADGIYQDRVYNNETKSWDSVDASGVKDYANATYREVTPNQVKAMKKAGQDLSNVYIMKKGRDGVSRMIKLTGSGSPDDWGSSLKGLRSNQSLNKSLEDADKIYVADVKDFLDSQPEKAHSRLDDPELRRANKKLGKSRGNISDWGWEDREAKDYITARQDIRKEIADVKAQYEEGNISRKEMERRIQEIKSYHSYSIDNYGKSYQKVRNAKADSRYKASEKSLQTPFRNLQSYRSELEDARDELSQAENDLRKAKNGAGAKEYTSYGSYAEAAQEAEKLRKQIADLQAKLAKYEDKINSGLQARDIAKYEAEIERQQANINNAQNKIDTLLRRNK